MTVSSFQRDLATHRAMYLGYLHIPYVFRGASVNGADCSGLALMAWNAGEVALPHNAAAMTKDPHVTYVKPTKANWSKVQSGDLVFFPGIGPDGKPGTFDDPQHVAVCVGKFDELVLIAQATDTELGSEVIRLEKYGKPLGFGFIGHS